MDHIISRYLYMCKSCIVPTQNNNYLSLILRWKHSSSLFPEDLRQVTKNLMVQERSVPRHINFPVNCTNQYPCVYTTYSISDRTLPFNWTDCSTDRLSNTRNEITNLTLHVPYILTNYINKPTTASLQTCSYAHLHCLYIAADTVNLWTPDYERNIVIRNTQSCTKRLQNKYIQKVHLVGLFTITSTNMSLCFKVSNVDKTMALWNKIYIYFSLFKPVPIFHFSTLYSCNVIVHIKFKSTSFRFFCLPTGCIISVYITDVIDIWLSLIFHIK
jgi:hypothetical protein